MFKCQTCEVYRQELAYLKEMINSLFVRLDMPMIESGQMVEDFKDEEQPTMNKDGFPAPEVHDD